MPTTRKTMARTAHQQREDRLLRRLLTGLRDTWVLFREFRDGLILFAVVILVGTVTFRLLWNVSQEEPMRGIEALFHIMTMTFLQPTLDFPRQWYLDLYFFIMPLLGLAAIARGLADFGTLLFNRNSRQAQWEEAMASTYSNHIIVAGLGHLGIRVVRELVILDEGVVVIELKDDSPQFAEVKSFDIPIIIGDARSAEVLQKAGVERAAAIIIATNNDLANLQIASRIRELDDDIRIVMRMFDDEFARSMADRFGISSVMSASLMAAPAFAGAATGTEIIQTFHVVDQVLAMGRLEVQAGSPLDGCVVRDIEHEMDINIVLTQNADGIDVHPEAGERLAAGDVIAVVATVPRIQQLAREWNRPPRS